MTLGRNPKSWLAIDIIPLGISLGFIREALRKKQEGAQIQEASKLKNIWLLSSEVSNRETLSFLHNFWSVSWICRFHESLSCASRVTSIQGRSEIARIRTDRRPSIKASWSLFRGFTVNRAFKFLFSSFNLTHDNQNLNDSPNKNYGECRTVANRIGLR